MNACIKCKSPVEHEGDSLCQECVRRVLAKAQQDTMFQKRVNWSFWTRPN